tara:strand:- start:2064 stop:2609 length:546 start_codon:yes stop_codon:yes gene_type:complete
MIVKIQTSINFDFKKLDKKINSIILNEIYRPIGEESKRQVEQTFKTSIDMDGNRFEPISDFYAKYNEYKSGKTTLDAPLVATGALSKSIRMETNPKGVSVYSNKGYGGKHLKSHTATFKIKGEERKAEVPQRLWFYRDGKQVVSKLKFFTSEKNSKFVKKIKSQLKTEMRSFGKKLSFKLF